MRVFLGVLLAAAAVTTFASAASSLPMFRTPSGNIGCYYSPKDPTTAAYLRCDIRTRLKPTPPKPARCVDLDWGDSYELNLTGRARLTCHGDTAIDPRARVLAYGVTWRRNGFSCVSRLAGLTCRNRSGHGFFLSRKRWYRF